MKGKTTLLIVVIVVWVALDQAVKLLLGAFPEGAFVAPLLGGVLDLRIVHNTGAAWGIFAGNPVALGIFSMVVCVLLLGYFAWARHELNTAQVLGIGLIIAGGIGNAIDRFSQGFVLDYLCTTFIDFPVFNIADIGVTCGVVILVIGLLAASKRENPEERS